MPLDKSYRGNGKVIKETYDFRLYVEKDLLAIQVVDYHAGILYLTKDDLLQIVSEMEKEASQKKD